MTKQIAVPNIAIIMPVWNAHSTIVSALHSIFMQRHVEFKVYLVVDGEEKGSYDYLKKKFKVKIHYLPVNAGPGVARQYGIDHTKEPYISFIDSDDAYLTTLALFYQHLPFTEDKTYSVVSCTFWQEQMNKSIKVHQSDMIWMHGKMYKRQFLDDNDIRFNETRANEDVGFNTQCQCYTSEKDQIVSIKEPTYMWQWRADSTVRADNQSYCYNESISGFVKNKIYAFERVLKKQPIDKQLIDNRMKVLIISGLVYLFNKYTEAKTIMPKMLKHIKTYSKIYYQKFYPLVKNLDMEKAVLKHLEVKNYNSYLEWQILLEEPMNKYEIKISRELERKKADSKVD